MALPEYVAPVLAVAGVPALIFAIMRCFPHAARALLLLLAGTVAIMTGNDKRRESCHEVLSALTRRDSKPLPGKPDSDSIDKL